jgi:N6-adenosine-specific RNA methylase IME4
MAISKSVVRLSVSLPAEISKHVRSLAKRRRQSANRILVSLIESGIEAQERKQQEFFEVAERFRASTDEAEVKRLGDQLGRMVFGD